MARDGAFPYSEWLRKINPTTKSPINVILLILCIDFVLLLIPLGSPLAFAAITSISTVGYQVSYAIPIILRLTTGMFEQGEHFNLGKYSRPMHFVSAVFLVVTGTYHYHNLITITSSPTKMSHPQTRRVIIVHTSIYFYFVDFILFSFPRLFYVFTHRYPHRH